jgi:hypothetical protein
VKYTDDFVLVAEKGTVLRGIIMGLIETGRVCGVEMNVEKPG